MRRVLRHDINFYARKVIFLLGFIVGIVGITFYISFIINKPGFNEQYTQQNISRKLSQTNTQKDMSSSEKEQNQEPEYPSHGYRSGPIVNLEEESYYVTGIGRKELCDQIASDERVYEDGRVELGNIQYSYSYSYETIYTGDGYTIGDFSVTTDSVILVPQWLNSEGAFDDTINDWRIFKNSVLDHERDHQEILVEHATEIVNAYNNLGVYETRAAAENAIEGIANSTWNEMKEAQENYDEEEASENEFYVFCYNRG